jgi:AAA+ superfamily predicted ATPase
VLHFLAGIHHLDDELRGYIRPVDPPTHLVPSHRALAERADSVWRHAADGASIPVLQFCGGDPATTHAIAVAAAANLDLRVLMIDALALPNSPADCETLRLLAVREAMLSGSVLLLNGYAADRSDSARDVLITRFAESSGCPLMIVGEERRRLPLRSIVTFDVAPPTFGERLDVWPAALGGFGGEIDPDLRRLATQFDLPPNAIRAACDREAAMCKHGAAPGDDRLDFGDRLWDACRIEARPRLDDLAQRIETDASWDDLVLPEKEKETLRDIATHVRCQSTVYEDWGFGESSPRGLGISALFAGASGTGKTLAAEVLANELRLDLYRIDLSRVVSKYIGETEKNLSRVFDAAERGGAVLLFDEADALFGKRSEVKDSHDRYANIEVSYLLQRMEAYRGLAILTTNMKSALDGAFLRRIRFIIRFPFPEAAQRAEIWRRIFPIETPTEGLDPERLAQLDIAGGTIRNIALNAAFLAADGGCPVHMRHVLAAARREYTKLEKSLTDVETRGWT